MPGEVDFSLVLGYQLISFLFGVRNQVKIFHVANIDYFIFKHYKYYEK